LKSGIINVYKEAGYTSFDVVAKLRGILKIKKIGHTGTLDPDATGVLPVCVGKATKVCDLLTDKDKTYVAVLHLGMVTDTQDSSGSILETHEIKADADQVRKTVASFVGPQKQIPPMYSALKVNGQKLCDLARKGVEVERQPRDITIYEINILEMALPLVKLEVHCSKGTYIRTLCHDIGQALGCGGCMDSLVRTKAAGFSIEDSLTLQEIEGLVQQGDLEKRMISVDRVFSSYGKAVAVSDATPLLENGNGISEDFVNQIIHTSADGAGAYSENGDNSKENGENSDNSDAPVRMYLADGRFVGIFEKKQGLWKPIKMFLE
jgi:tRNA pseudouridine55 synthase